MKVLTTIFFFSISLTCFAQEKMDLVPQESPLLKYIDEEFIHFLLDIHDLDKTVGPAGTVSSVFASHNAKIAKQYKDANNPKFDFLVSYYTQLSKRNKDILSDQFLSKPSLNDLFSIYLAKEIESNSFAGPRKISEADLIAFEVTHFPSEYSLLLTYYNVLFHHVSENSLLKESFDINFEELGLTAEEGTIIYYVVLFRLGEMASAVENQKCKPFLKIEDKLPTFNGQAYYNFDPSPIDKLINTIRHQKKSWDVLPFYTKRHKEVLDMRERCHGK